MSAESLVAQLNDILDLSNIEAGRLELDLALADRCTPSQRTSIGADS